MLVARMPPAVFPVILGLLGLGLGWRLAAARFDYAAGVAEVALALICAIYAVGLAAYGTKLARRSNTYHEDLKSIPGRTGVAAMWMCLMLCAAVLMPSAPRLALAVLALALLGHALTMILVARNLIATKGPATPAIHLIFVGMIVSVPSFGLLDAHGPGIAITAYAVPALFVISVLTGPPLFRRDTPPPLRPLQVIHLAPAAVAVLAAEALNLHALGLAMLAWATLLFITLLVRLRWIIAAGFLPAWSAFTFPVVSYGSALLVAGETWDSVTLDGVGAVILAVSSIITPVIAARTFRLWHNGRLAEATAAAQA